MKAKLGSGDRFKAVTSKSKYGKKATKGKKNGK